MQIYKMTKDIFIQKNYYSGKYIKMVRFTKCWTIRGYLIEYFIIFKVLNLLGFSSIHYISGFLQNKKMSSSVYKDCVAMILKFLEDQNFINCSYVAEKIS